MKLKIGDVIIVNEQELMAITIAIAKPETF